MGLIRRWIRRKLARKPFPVSWLPYLERNVPFYRRLQASLRERFLEMLKIFIWERTFLGGAGLEVTDEMRVTIGAAAIRLVLHLDLSYYDRMSDIVVYPYDFIERPVDGGPGGISEDEIVLGEMHEWGVVVLSWPAVLEGMRSEGDAVNPALHEFAHALDRATGVFDGTPDLGSLRRYGPWARVMSREFLRLRRGRGKVSRVLDEYGAKSEAEFFAVATEAFFERPLELKEDVPELYGQLKRFYRCDPAQELLREEEEDGERS